MTITRKQIDTTLIIALQGKLDTLAAPQLHEEINKGLTGLADMLGT